ncbi:hypothetical protein BGX28_001413 [Mortierella sp. GBA30]|nr:hypothetical protein BGX28_001413 [Mortierella sp. GBA30]
MYWRFGHQNASVIDHLLESGNISLEELLEQDDLIQECKAQNPRLIEYLRDPSVLQQLLSYITSDELEDRARFKYPFIACEVIACEVWGIFESALSNVDMLVKFWEFLDRPPPLNPVQASYFAKVIGVFLMKKTGEMMHFIRSQPEVVPKLLLHMSTSSIMDLLLKIISMEESPEGKGTVQWLSEQGLMPWLVNRLDPNFDAEVHSIASQVLLDIIAISQSSHPEQPSIGTNMLIDELKSEVIVSQLVSFMLDRDAPYSSSTLINGVTIFIELIRRNNSDYDIEPLPPNAEPPREPVDLSDLLKVLATRIEDFKDLLIVPRSVTGPIETSIGKQTPLGFERLKICEMFAELLHCSNMAVLNSRPIISVSPDGTVRIPTVSLDCAFSQHQHELSRISSVSKSPNANGATKADLAHETQETDEAEEKESAKPVSNLAQTSDDLENGSSTPKGIGKGSITPTDDQTTPRASPSLGPTSTCLILMSATISTLAAADALEKDVMIPVGDFLKLQFVDHRIIPTCFDLFFQFPWNNFLHTVVYDMVHQVFHRPMGDIGRQDNDGTYIPPKANQDLTEGWNRRLTISIFKDGQLAKRITDAQRLCDYECALPKGVRLGYMGHLTYIADETVKLLELYQQTSLLSTLYEFIDLEDWWNYVSKVLKETKERDAQVLGGARPNVVESHNPGHVDPNDDDYMDDNDDEYGSNDFIGGENGTGLEGDVASDQFARYLCQQITNNLPDKFGSSDEDEDDEEDNWTGEYGVEGEFDRAGAADRMDDPFGDSNPLDFDSDDDEGVDEETWNTPWPSTFSENKPTDSGSSTQFIATVTDHSENTQGRLTGNKSMAESTTNSVQPTVEADAEKRADVAVGASIADSAIHAIESSQPTNTSSSVANTAAPVGSSASIIPGHAEQIESTAALPTTVAGAAASESRTDDTNSNKVVTLKRGIVPAVEAEATNASSTIATNISSTTQKSADKSSVTLAPEIPAAPVVQEGLKDVNDGSSSTVISPSSTSSINSTHSISSITVEPPTSVSSLPSTPASSSSPASASASSEVSSELRSASTQDTIGAAILLSEHTESRPTTEALGSKEQSSPKEASRTITTSTVGTAEDKEKRKV